MPNLRPLKQWYCDECGRMIESENDGWLEWLCDDEHKSSSFRIVHHKAKSPYANNPDREGCYKYTGHAKKMDLSLDNFTGSDGMSRMLSLIDNNLPGSHHRIHRETDLIQWTEIFRRLFLPHFEEARRYFNTAFCDGFIDDYNEVIAYHESTLIELLKKYA